jgi:hypothetical protein
MKNGWSNKLNIEKQDCLNSQKEKRNIRSLCIKKRLDIHKFPYVKLGYDKLSTKNKGIHLFCKQW